MSTDCEVPYCQNRDCDLAGLCKECLEQAIEKEKIYNNNYRCNVCSEYNESCENCSYNLWKHEKECREQLEKSLEEEAEKKY